jgi:hypothetical protein
MNIFARVVAQDLARMDDALKEARALAEIEAVAIAADTVAVASRSLPPRRAASAKPVKYAYDSEVRLLPIRPRSRGARRSLRTFPVVTLHPRFPFNV